MRSVYIVAVADLRGILNSFNEEGLYSSYRMLSAAIFNSAVDIGKTLIASTM
jgi:hypothetical protein